MESHKQAIFGSKCKQGISIFVYYLQDKYQVRDIDFQVGEAVIILNAPCRIIYKQMESVLSILFSPFWQEGHAHHYSVAIMNHF